MDELVEIDELIDDAINPPRISFLPLLNHGPHRMMDHFQRVSVPIAIGIVLGTTTIASSAPPTAAAALSLKPVQANVDYEVVPADAQDGCRVVDIQRDGWTGWEVTLPDGSLLRRFADTNGDKKIDLWCYYKFGVEVYRDIDEDYNGKADQYRWLATSGMRWGLDDDEDGRVDRWKQISAEEVTAEVVAALRENDPVRFVRLLISPTELNSLGLGSEKLAQLEAKSERASRGFADLAERQSSIGEEARWVQFAAASPGVVPKGTEGSTKDVVVYENAVAMFEQGEQSGQLMVGTLVKVGDAWRLVELPSVGEDGVSVAQSSGNFFTPGGSGPAAGMANSNLAQETQDLVNNLEKIDGKLATAKDSSELASLHQQRADIVEKLIGGSGNAADRDTWVRQLVDMLSVGAQTGSYPDGVTRLRSVASKFAGNDESLKSYADYQAISTEYVVRQTPDADFAKVQEWYLDSLSGFVERYPRTAEAAQAWLQLALSKEFEDKEKEALVFYKKVAAAFPSTDAGEKAAGAVRRLESVGQRVDLEGTTLQGQTFRLSQLRGKPIVLHYWATWCEPCKQDMKLLRRLQASYQRAGLQIVGVNVDVTQNMAERFLKENRLPWTHLYEEGGLESSTLAKAFGVQTLPTMMLIDKQGKVVRHNVRAAELDGVLDQMVNRN